MRRVCHAPGGAYPGGVRVGAGRHPDRWLAFGALLIVTAVFAVVITRSGEPELTTPRPDPTAAPRMLALMRAGDGVNSGVTYDYTRRLADGARRTVQTREAQSNGTHGSRTADTLDVTSAAATYHCEIVDEPTCTRKATSPTLPASEVFAAAIRTGAYVVTRARDATIAGEAARCFATKSVNGRPYLPEIGSETLACFAADGVILRRW